MKEFITLLIVALMTIPAGMANGQPDDDDKTTGLKQEIRRLHPERHRAQAIKKLQEQQSRKSEPKADPWDTDGEVWGTVDLPPATSRDSSAVEGRRLEPSTVHTIVKQSATSRLGHDSDGESHRLSWQDQPVTVAIDLLWPYFTIVDGECRSKYVTADGASNEVYFTFTIDGDSVSGPLRLCVRYCTDQPLDFDQLIFTIDGFNYPFYPQEPQHAQLANGQYLETSDDVLRPAHKDLVYALAHGSWAALKLVNTRGIQRVKMLTDGQRQDFAHTLDLYRLLGGGF